MCTINKSANTKKSGNVFNDPRISADYISLIDLLLLISPLPPLHSKNQTIITTKSE